MPEQSQADKIFLKSSLEGQKQLMKFGESLAIQKQIDENRLDKDKKIEEYIGTLEISIPDGLKNQNYINSMRDFYEENNSYIERYKQNKIAQNSFSSKEFDEKKIIEDIMHLYYGYKLKESFRKKLERELEKEKSAHKKTQESFNELAIESSEHEDTIDKLEELKFFTYIAIYVLFALLVISNSILSVYLFYGPDALYNDSIIFFNNVVLGMYMIWYFMKFIIEGFISLYTDVPEYVRGIYFVIGLTLSTLVYYYKISLGDMYNLSKKYVLSNYNNLSEKIAKKSKGLFSNKKS